MNDFTTYFIIFIVFIIGLMQYENFTSDLTFVKSNVDNKIIWFVNYQI